MFGSTIKSEGDHDRFRSKADRVNVITRMTREERMAKVDEKHGVDRDKDSDDDLDSDWSDSSDDDSSDEYTDSDPDASRSGTDDDSSSASAKGSIKEETPAQKEAAQKKQGGGAWPIGLPIGIGSTPGARSGRRKKASYSCVLREIDAQGAAKS